MNSIIMIGMKLPPEIFAAFDWGRVGRSALIGGIIGGAYGLYSMLKKKKDKGDD